MDDVDPEANTEPEAKVLATPPGARRPDVDKLTQHETFLLYGLMQSRCAKCKMLVVRESEASGRAFNLGKRAHMVARSEVGPRGDASVPARERGDISNHLLLCGTCHDEIDLDEEGWPLKRLQKLREDHLAWVAGRAPSDSRRDALNRAHKKSIGRCIHGWQALGVDHVMATQLADDESVGALPADIFATGPITVLTGDVGVGKSLGGERLHQAAIMIALDDPAAPAPVWLLAADAGSDLDRAVSEADTGPADAHHPVALVIDGLDEPGPAAAAALLGQARVLAQVRPGSRIVLTTRLITGLGNPDERRTVKPLDRAEASALMDRIHPGARNQWHRLAEPLQEAALRPLFAVAAAVLASAGETASAPAQVIDQLVRRAAGDRWRALRGPLIELSVRSLRRDGATVRPQDLAPPDVLDALLATRIVVEHQDRLRFPLILFAQWFAAQGIIEGSVDVDDLLDDVARLENWRYPLAIAVHAAPTVIVNEVLEALTRRQPGFASIVLSEAVAQIPAGHPDVHDGLEAGVAVRDAAQAWLDGLRSLAPSVMPLDDYGALRPLGVDLDNLSPRMPQLTTTWWEGPPERPEVFLLPPWRSLGSIPAGWGAWCWGHPVSGPAWPWEWVRDSIARNFQKILKARALPVGGSPLEHEAVWDVAWRLVAERSPDGLPVAGLMALDPEGEVTIGDTDINVWDLQQALRRHATEDHVLPRPWPAQLHAADTQDPDGWVRRAEYVFATALDAYEWFARHSLAALAPQLETAVLLPAIARGRVWPKEPMVEWWLELREPGQRNGAEFQLGQPNGRFATRMEDFDRRRQTVQLLRPEAARWASIPWQAGGVQLSGRCPATDLVYKMLWTDFGRLRLTKGTFPEWSFRDLADLRPAA